MASGEMTEAEFTGFLTQVFRAAAAVSRDGALHYICMDWRHLYEALSAGRAVYSSFLNLCVWNKDNGGTLWFNLCDGWASSSGSSGVALGSGGASARSLYVFKRRSRLVQQLGNGEHRACHERDSLVNGPPAPGRRCSNRAIKRKLQAAAPDRQASLRSR
jgi:hypothetical protein